MRGQKYAATLSACEAGFAEPRCDMKQFMDEDFLLSTPTAVKLYHEYAECMPIIDYHCHLNPKEIAENKPFRNVTELFLGGDHYKWRFMATMGVDDKFIRGDGDDYEKFLAYAKCISVAIGNPLYHWTHLELKRVFGITETLNEDTAPAIWEKCNALLATPEFLPRNLIKKFNVKVVCTTDDPADSMEYHARLKKEGFEVKVLPTYRPDKAVKINFPGFTDYIPKLAKAASMEIASVNDVLAALRVRADFFASIGCRLSDHDFYSVPYAPADYDTMNAIFKKAMKGEAVSPAEAEQYRTYLMIKLGCMYAELGWTQQYHMNAQRNNNTPIFNKYGADVGFDSISDEPISAKLNALMNEQEKAGKLPRTILYTLNPGANYVLGTTCGNFQTEAGIPGKIQFGSAWWFCDQRDGMEEQMKTLAALGSLSCFVGMLTDSRSFVSYPRHEYFRRILCDILGKWVENGEFPMDEKALKTIVQGICYNNALNYFKF